MEIFTQGDNRWAGKKLGNSGLSMEHFGCLVTAVAQALRIAGYDTDPGRLVDSLNKIGGFTSNGLLIWGKVTQLYSGFHYNEHSGSQYDFVNVIWGRYNHYLLNHKGIIYDPLLGKHEYPYGSKNIGYRWASIYGPNGQLT